MAIDISGTRSGTYILRNTSNETVNFVSGAVINANRGGGILASVVRDVTFNLDGYVKSTETYARTYGVQASGNDNTFNIGAGFEYTDDNPSLETGAILVQGSNNLISNSASLDYQEGIRISGAGNIVANSGLISRIEISNEMSIVNSGQLGQVVVRDEYFRTSNVTIIVNDGEWGGLNNSGTSTNLNAFEGSGAAELVLNNNSISGDVLLGGGNDTFRNNGGYVAGQVFGGAGDDTFIIDRGTVRGIGGPLPGLYTVVERAGEGTDTVILSGDFLSDLPGVFQLFDHVEDVMLSEGVGGKVRGNSLANFMSGSNGDDVLDGADGDDTLQGSLGSDTLIGGAGIDTALYQGNQADYVVTRNANGTVTVTGVGSDPRDGTDTLSLVETLQFADGALDLRAAVNVPPVIVSNGGGSTASVEMAEGKTVVTAVQARSEQGTVTYALSNTADAALFSINATTGALTFRKTPDFEAPRDAGRDNIYDVTVIASNGQASDEQALAVIVTNVAGLTRTGSGKNDVIRGGTEDDVLSGGRGRDTLVGGAGNDRLSGGLDADVLIGGSGKDTFTFNTKPGSSNIDRVTDFTVRVDTIQLDDDIFKKLGKVGDLAPSAIWTGTKAHDANDRIVYDKKSGKVWYDEDGNGSAAPIQILQLSKALALSAHDFDIIA